MIEPYDPATTPWLHVYGQYAYHDPVHIVGTRLGLLRLVNACLAAMAEPPLYETAIPQPTLFTNDGEGYDLHVACVPTAEAMGAYVKPYHALWAVNAEDLASPQWPLKEEERTP